MKCLNPVSRNRDSFVLDYNMMKCVSFTGDVLDGVAGELPITQALNMGFWSLALLRRLYVLLRNPLYEYHLFYIHLLSSLCNRRQVIHLEFAFLSADTSLRLNKDILPPTEPEFRIV